MYNWGFGFPYRRQQLIFGGNLYDIAVRKGLTLLRHSLLSHHNARKRGYNYKTHFGCVLFSRKRIHSFTDLYLIKRMLGCDESTRDLSTLSFSGMLTNVISHAYSFKMNSVYRTSAESSQSVQVFCILTEKHISEKQ